MWLIFSSLAAVAGLFALFAIKQALVRRRSASRPLPPICATDDHVTSPAPPLEVLMRDSLVNPNRVLNVHAWDNTPSTGPQTDLDGVPDFEAEPLVIDRNFLANRGPRGGEDA